MDLRDKVIEFIETKSKASGNHSGLLLPVICSTLEVGSSELKPILNALYKEGFIQVRDGINGKLIFKTKT